MSALREGFCGMSTFSWHVMGGYLGRSVYIGNGKRKTVYLHREIMGATDSQVVDHINGNKLDNRKSNLRLCTRIQNSYNRQPTQKTGVKGVHYERNRAGFKKWRAYINSDGARKHLGYYGTKAEAISVYNEKAKELHGDFARLNVNL